MGVRNTDTWRQTTIFYVFNDTRRWVTRRLHHLSWGGQGKMKEKIFILCKCWTVKPDDFSYSNSQSEWRHEWWCTLKLSFKMPQLMQRLLFLCQTKNFEIYDLIVCKMKQKMLSVKSENRFLTRKHICGATQWIYKPVCNKSLLVYESNSLRTTGQLRSSNILLHLHIYRHVYCLMCAILMNT